jgi:hypothetical protein
LFFLQDGFLDHVFFHIYVGDKSIIIEEREMRKLLIALFVMGLSMAVSTAAEAASCNANLVRGNGQIGRTFSGWGYERREACRDARRQCNRRLSEIRMRRPHARAYCEVDRRDHRQRVTRSCTAERRSFRGGRGGWDRHVRTFFGQATGRRGTGVRRQACNNAMRQCQRSSSRRDVCRIIR